MAGWDDYHNDDDEREKKTYQKHQLPPPHIRTVFVAGVFINNLQKKEGRKNSFRKRKKMLKNFLFYFIFLIESSG